MPQSISPNELLALTAPVVTIVLTEHLGDIVACEPVIRYAKTIYPGHNIAWVTQEKYFEAIVGHPLLDFIVPVRHLVEATALALLMSTKFPVINLHFRKRYCSVLKQYVTNSNDANITDKNYFHWGSLLEAFSLSARLPKLACAPEFHILPASTAPSLPGGYVVLHCLSNETEKDWNEGEWQKLLDFLFSQGHHVAEIGFTPLITSASHLYHDMTHIHSIQILARIISKATFFFGVDSAFAHIANALKVNGLVIMGLYRDFSEHVPFTGMYSQGHIVRSYGGSASLVGAQDVIKRHQELLGA